MAASERVGHAVGVPIDLSILPDDPETLQHMLREVVAAAERQQAALQGAISERDAEIDKLHLLIQRLMRHQFGRRSEQMSSEQFQLGLEDLEQGVAANQAAQDAATPEQANRGSDGRRVPIATTAPCLRICRAMKY